MDETLQEEYCDSKDNRQLEKTIAKVIRASWQKHIIRVLSVFLQNKIPHCQKARMNPNGYMKDK